MRTLLEDGILKAVQGLTTLEEVARVAGNDGGNAPKGDAPESGISDKPVSVEEQTEPDAAEMAPATAGTSDTPGGSQGKETVLVVEDSKTIASVVKYFLESRGSKSSWLPMVPLVWRSPNVSRLMWL